MSEKLSWIFALEDRLSGPATKMEKALGGVEEKLHAAELELARSKLDRIKDPLERNAAALRVQRMELQQLALAHKEGGEHAGSFFEKLRHGLEIVYFGKEVLGSIVEKLHEVAGEIVGAVGFKQRSMLGLEALLGDRDKAIEVFEDVEHAALKTGTSVATVMERTKDLLTAGFGIDEIGTIRKGIADLGVVMGPEKAAALSEQIADIGRNGMMTSRQLMALRHVLPMEELRKELGITADGMNKLLDGSKAVEAGKAVSAILKTIRDRYSGGILGSLAEKDAKTLPKLIERVKMLPEIVMSAVAGFGGQGTKPWETLLDNIATTFDPSGPSGTRIVERVRGLFDEVGRAFGITSGAKGGLLAELTGPDGVKKIEEIFNHVADGIRSAIPVIKEAAGLVWSVVELLAKAARTVAVLRGDDSVMPEHLYELGEQNQRGMAERTLLDPNASPEAREYARRIVGQWQPPAAAPTASSAQTQHITFAGDVHFHGVKDAEQAGNDFAKWLSDHTERQALQAGG